MRFYLSSPFHSSHLIAFYLICVAAVVDQSNFGSLTILADNDLSGNQTTHNDGAILVGKPKNYNQAQASCGILNETLWSPENQRFLSGLNSSLSYQVYLHVLQAEQLLWVERTNFKDCRAMDTAGNLYTLGCQHAFQTLCTHSAPLSTANISDTSINFRIAHHVGNQTIVGYRDSLSWRFLGLRYALEPKRFSYSSLYSGEGKALATRPGPQCIQASGQGSEDCLFLNIFSPFLTSHQTPRQNLKAVMFWIHGGAFTGGTGNDPTFDGSNLASRGDVVLITINYRLSTLGFLALDDGVTNGNFGLQDIIIALKWVKENIRPFGGDSDRVTVFGQSAGAAAVRALISSPEARGLFSAAIPQSNLAGSNYATTYSSYYSIGQEVATIASSILNETGCSTRDPLPCLRQYDAQELVKLAVVARYLVVDGKYLKESQLDVIHRGNAASVPILTGLMRDDGAAFITYTNTTSVSEALKVASFNASVIEASGIFPTPNGDNATLNVFNVTARVATDSEFRCLDQASMLSAVRNKIFPDVYFYEFNRSYQLLGYDPNAPVCDAPINMAMPAGDPGLEYFKCHSGDLYYTFGNLHRMGLPDRDGLDVLFSQVIVDYWTSFARTHDPNPPPGYLAARGYWQTGMMLQENDVWTPINPRTPTLRQLQWRSRQIAFKDVEQCDLVGLPLSYYEGSE